MNLITTANNVSVIQKNNELIVNGVKYDCTGVKTVKITNTGIYFDGHLIDDKKYLRRNKIPYIIAVAILVLIPICYLLINIL